MHRTALLKAEMILIKCAKLFVLVLRAITDDTWAIQDGIYPDPLPGGFKGMSPFFYEKN
jgi:hypothetical protein